MESNLLSATEAARQIASGRLSSETLVRACLDRIAEREEIVGAWQVLDHDRALAEARARDRGSVAGPLHGIPFAAKDVIETSDLPTGYGSAIYRNYQPSRDAACLALVRAAGGILLGKTVSAEFAFFTPGKTANPHNPNHTPGGSSSGSAAAVADYMVPLAFGTQTAGSVIRPAAFCGVVGYKPTFGLISRAGVLSFAESHDTVGVFARTVQDVALITSVASSRPALREVRHVKQPVVVGLCRTPDWDKASDEARLVIMDVFKRLSAAGVRVSEVTMPVWFNDLGRAQATVMAFEAARSFAHERRSHGTEISPAFRALLEQGDRCSVRAYDEAMALARAGRRELQSGLERTDILLTLSAPGEAPEGLSSTGDPIFNRAWSLLKVPCIHIPTARGARGLPLGFQLIGRVGDDARVLSLAAWAERTTQEG
jgi:Asp-tRNA(Asn)/Glu-tRNA(Gln) amidotransferase A subunit family amidase